MYGARRPVLLLADRNEGNASTIEDHASSFARYSKYEIWEVNPVNRSKVYLPPFEYFSAIVIHYTVFLAFPGFLGDWFKKQISAYTGPKLIFVQDEYANTKIIGAEMKKLKIDTLFTLIDLQHCRAVWTEEFAGNIEFVHTLAGYVTDEMKRMKPAPASDRDIDIGYRGRKFHPALGALGQERHVIGDDVGRALANTDLKLDISSNETDRIYGDNWVKFLNRCKCVLGTESGASQLDPDGKLRARIDEYMKSRPAADFAEIQKVFLNEGEGVRAVSARVFEAAANGCGQILYEGHYSGVIEPHVHYFPLKKDLSNLEEAVEFLRSGKWQQTAENARRDLIESGKFGYDRLVRTFDDHLEVLWERKQLAPRNLLQIISTRPNYCMVRIARPLKKAGKMLFLRLIDPSSEFLLTIAPAFYRFRVFRKVARAIVGPANAHFIKMRIEKKMYGAHFVEREF